MRGFVFSEFLDFVETKTDPEMVEHMLEQCALASGGAYTAVGTYHHGEILKMLDYLHQKTGVAVNSLLTEFGQHLFGQLIRLHPDMRRPETGLLDFLAGIETHIHREVRKLYPSAELPFFVATRHDANHLTLEYRSTRPLAGLAAGMIAGAIEHFDGQAQVEQSTQEIPGFYAAKFKIGLTA